MLEMSLPFSPIENFEQFGVEALRLQTFKFNYLACSIGVVGAILIGFFHIFVYTVYPMGHKIILKRQFMQTALVLQDHAKIFSRLVPSLQKLANFDNIFATSE